MLDKKCLDKSCRENKKCTLNSKMFLKNLAIFEIKLKNITELNRPQMTI